MNADTTTKGFQLSVHPESGTYPSPPTVTWSGAEEGAKITTVVPQTTVEAPIDPSTEDFAHVAALLRVFANEDQQKLRATLSNNLNVILAALDISAGAK